MLNYKKPTFWIIVVAVFACLIVAICFLTNPKEDDTISDPFGRNYSVEAVVYDAPQYSLSLVPETAPDYRLTDDWQLLILQKKDSAKWQHAGTFAEELLSTSTFDNCFNVYDGVSGWKDDNLNAEKLRLNTRKAWRLDVPQSNSGNVFYLLLQLENGDVYLTYGYDDGESPGEAKSGSLIRWVFKLGTEATTSTGDGDAQSAQTPALTLGDVRALLFKGDTLTWADFDGFSYIETGSGLYIRVYEIDEQFSLWIGGGPTDESPLYIRLVSKADLDDYVDIRTENVQAFINAHSTDPLDSAVSAAILDHNKSEYHERDFSCESHVTLHTEVSSISKRTTVYAMVFYQEYDIASDGIYEGSGSHIPTAFTFEIGEDGAYTLVEYWVPRDGSYYEPDIRKRFPSLIVEDALDTQKHILAQIQNCYAQAVTYGKLDTGVIIERLLEVIISSPASSSGAGSYIDAHPAAYRELMYYGDFTLRFVFDEFLKGGQTDLRGHILRSLMDDLIGDEALKLDAATGQEYFNAWREHIEEVYEQKERKYLRENYPKGWLLLRMIG